jgi:hypothetical protein
MNIIAWILSLSILVVLMIQAVDFHKATVCRQKAWQKSTELLTRNFLSEPKPIERSWELGCRIHLVRNHDEVTWQRLPSLNAHKFVLPVKGSL